MPDGTGSPFVLQRWKRRSSTKSQYRTTASKKSFRRSSVSIHFPISLQGLEQSPARGWASRTEYRSWQRNRSKTGLSSNGDVARINNSSPFPVRPRFQSGRNGPPAFPLCHRASGPCRAPFALPSQWIQGREVEMTVQCQNRANCAVVYRCQIRSCDEKMRGSNEGIDG